MDSTRPDSFPLTISPRNPNKFSRISSTPRPLSFPRRAGKQGPRQGASLLKAGFVEFALQQIQFQSKAGEKMQMNYFYSHYPYLMNLPIMYPNEYHSSFNFPQNPFSLSIVESENHSPPPMKVEDKESTYAQPKEFSHPPADTAHPRLKFQNSQSKKTQTDSFTEKRNIVPNNINHILAFVQRKSKSQPLVKKLIRQYDGPESYTPKRFYCYQGQLKQKLHVHVNKQSLKKLINHLDLHSQIFAVEEQLFYNRICRVLICYYLREVAKITILSSGRVKQTNKKDHLQAQRTLLCFMLSGDYSQ